MLCLASGWNEYLLLKALCFTVGVEKTECRILSSRAGILRKLPVGKAGLREVFLELAIAGDKLLESLLRGSVRGEVFDPYSILGVGCFEFWEAGA